MKRRLLLSTTSHAMKHVYRPFLERCGYEMDLAETGPDCAEQLRDNPPDILLLDSRRLGSEADEIIDQMRSDPELYAIPVVLITDEQNPDQLNLLQEDPIVTCLQTPFDGHTLFEQILFADSHTYKAFVEQSTC